MTEDAHPHEQEAEVVQGKDYDVEFNADQPGSPRISRCCGTTGVLLRDTIPTTP